MVSSFLQRKLKDIPISQKLYFTIGIMVLLITLELFTLWFAINTLSSVRSLVGGEGLWSKAQKDAVFHLSIYGYSRDLSDYEAFHNFLKVPLGDKKAREAMLKKAPDLKAAREGFIEGRNHPDDVDGMITLLMRFNNIYYIDRALTIWGEAERKLETLVPIGEKLHGMISSESASQKEIDQVLEEVELINADLTKLEDEFSFTLGEGSRWLENLILTLLLALTITVETIGILITISVSRGIKKGLKEVISGAELIGNGVLSTRVKVYSRDEIGILASSFNQMAETLERNIRELKYTEENLKKEKDRAEASEKVKQLFLANMSHEIRTPMNAILGFSRLLEESRLDKEQREYILAIIRSGDDLLVILNDILDFSRIKEGRIVFEKMPFLLEDTIKSTVFMMQSKSSVKSLKLSYHKDPKIPEVLIGDSIRLNQILLNLVSNAIKFTERGEIKISVFCFEESNSNITLEFIISDTGIGIPPEKQEVIFESFEQAAAGSARRFGGTGLGLSIVKQLVEQQNGEVYVNSKPGNGSDFHFRLTFGKKAEKPYINVDLKEKILKDEINLKADGHGICILIVEDNPINQLLATKVLQRQGFETDIAENGKVALQKHIKNRYDIILMDLQMPEMDGYETTRNIRIMKNDKKDIPIIAMTAHTIKGERERCMDTGMTDYISKPFQAGDLYNKIHQLIKKVEA